MSFATAVNCMDGRAQTPVAEYLRERFDVAYVDAVTEAGAVSVVADGRDGAAMASILKRLDISIKAHASVGIAVVAHHDCAGNPVAEAVQREQLERAVAVLRVHAGTLPVVGLWVGADWQVEETVSAD